MIGDSNSSSGKSRRPRAVEDVARSDRNGLAGLLARARRLQALDRTLAATLDPRLAPHVRVANVRDGKLILATPVAPIAQRLRMEKARLLEALGREHPGAFTDMEIRITPDLPPREP